MLLDDTILPPGLTPEEAREACRALKGTMLRQEVYALDGKPESVRPYSVAESNFTSAWLQQRGPNRHAVLLHACPRAGQLRTTSANCTTVAGCLRADPRVSHDVTLEVDEFGNVLKSVAIGLRPAVSTRRAAADGSRQQPRFLLTLTENDHTNAVDDARCLPHAAARGAAAVRVAEADARWRIFLASPISSGSASSPTRLPSGRRRPRTICRSSTGSSARSGRPIGVCSKKAAHACTGRRSAPAAAARARVRVAGAAG